MTLTDFLLARIAEDREAAEKASQGRWKLWGMQVMADTFGDSNVDHAALVANTQFVDDNGKPRTWNAHHIAQWDPARVLAECEAKRRIVNDAGFAAHQAEINNRTPATEPVFAAALLAFHVLAHLARPYADHPDYDRDWRP